MLKHLQSRDEWTEKSLGAKGFTLIELLVVIIILGILAAVAIFAVGSINDRAKQNSCKNEGGTVQTAVEAYNAQMGTYPTSVNQLTADTQDSDGNPVKAELKAVPHNWTVSSDGSGTVSKLSTAPSNC